MARPPIPCPWLHELAAGYLCGAWQFSAERRAGRWGCCFARKRGRSKLGFFVGFLTRPATRASLRLDPPECAVFAFVLPVGGRLHQRMVRQQGSPLRRSHELITKYTARRPRFEFHEQHAFALIRHVPLSEFPRRQRAKCARNFFMETLALLVRTRLPEALLRVRLRAR